MHLQSKVMMDRYATCTALAFGRATDDPAAPSLYRIMLLITIDVGILMTADCTCGLPPALLPETADDDSVCLRVVQTR